MRIPHNVRLLCVRLRLWHPQCDNTVYFGYFNALQRCVNVFSFFLFFRGEGTFGRKSELSPPLALFDNDDVSWIDVSASLSTTSTAAATFFF